MLIFARLQHVALALTPTYIDIHTHPRRDTDTHTNTHTHAPTHARTHARTHTHAHPRRDTDTHTNTRTHSRTHARTHAHTHTHTHLFIYIPDTQVMTVNPRTKTALIFDLYVGLEEPIGNIHL